MIKKRGASTVEVIMVVMLIIILSITMASLIISGAQVQDRITQKQAEQMDARTTLSVIQVLLKQHDNEQLQIKSLPSGDKAIFIGATPDIAMDLWYFYAGGVLYESFTSIGEYPTPDTAMDIIEMNGVIDLAFDQEKQMIITTISYDYGEDIASMTGKYTIRSQGGAYE